MVSVPVLNWDENCVIVFKFVLQVFDSFDVMVGTSSGVGSLVAGSDCGSGVSMMCPS